jgi:transcription elongation factor GreA
MAEQQDTIWLTQEAFDKLTDELNELKDVGRPTVSRKIAAARAEGDLSENGGYHAAREEQGQMESRILQLEQMLRDAKVGEPGSVTDTAVVGSQVEVAYDGDPDDTEVFLIGSREMLGLDDSVDTQVYSPQSPLGAAVLGAKEGDEVSYQAPSGKTINLTVVAVRPFGN